MIWAEAQAELGRLGAAVLVLLADAGSIERRGTHSLSCGMDRAMAARAESEPLRLSQNLFGLLHRTRGLTAPPHPRALTPDPEEPVMPRLLTLGSLPPPRLRRGGLGPALVSGGLRYRLCRHSLHGGGVSSEPSGTCSDAYDYMIDRITDRPPEPPFDTCTMSDGSAYDAAEVAFARPSRQSRVGWICPEPAPMAFDETADYTFATPSCYPTPSTSLLRRGTGSSARQWQRSVSPSGSRSPFRPAAAVSPMSRRSFSPTPTPASLTLTPEG